MNTKCHSLNKYFFYKISSFHHLAIAAMGLWLPLGSCTAHDLYLLCSSAIYTSLAYHLVPRCRGANSSVIYNHCVGSFILNKHIL